MADNRLLSESDLWFSPSQMKQGAKNALLYPLRHPEQTAEFGLSVAPGSGEAMSARDAWDASGRAGNALLSGNYGEAASEYGNVATGMLGAIPGAGIIARGTKRGAAWMDRNLPAGVNKLLDAVTPQASQDTLYAIPAWHGSPHDFDEFKLDKIGTGEGAQAYGHGLYFAENPAVAKRYQEQLSLPSVNGQVVSHPDLLIAEFARAKLDGKLSEYIKFAENSIAQWSAKKASGKVSPEFADAQIRKNQTELDLMKQAETSKVASSGRLYRTELDVEPEDLLDWDKPLSQQGEIGQKALAVFERMGIAQDGRFKPDTLAGIKDVAAQKYGRDSFAASSRALREAGIPGIRYLDQGSRGAGQGSSNFVIFDDSLVKILGKE